MVTDKQKGYMTERGCGKYESGLLRYYKKILNTYLISLWGMVTSLTRNYSIVFCRTA